MTDNANSWYWEQRWASFRRGSALIRLEWDGGEAQATVYDVGVPETAAAIFAALPLVVPVVHAAWSGDMLMSTRPYDINAKKFENEVRLVRPGDLTWDPSMESWLSPTAPLNAECQPARIRWSCMGRFRAKELVPLRSLHVVGAFRAWASLRIRPHMMASAPATKGAQDATISNPS